MATLAVNRPTRGGGTVTNNVDDGGNAVSWASNAEHDYPNTGREVLYITKGTGAAMMTIESNADDPFDGTALANSVITIAENTTEVYGPYSPDKHNDADGLTQISFSDDGGLQVTVLRI